MCVGPLHSKPVRSHYWVAGSILGQAHGKMFLLHIVVSFYYSLSLPHSKKAI